MNTNGLYIEVEHFKGNYPAGVIPRSTVMLYAALREAAVTEGSFRFDVDGPFAGLMSHSLPFCEVLPSAQVPNVIIVRLKSSGCRESAIQGRLRIPQGMDRMRLLKELAPGIQNYNADGWREAFKDVPPNPPPARASGINGARLPLPVQLPPPVVKVRTKELPPGRVPCFAKMGTDAVLAVSSKAASPVAPSSSDAEDGYDQLLIKVLESHPDGTFSGKDVARIAPVFFHGKKKGWYTAGAIRVLLGKRYMRQVLPKGGNYQVATEFIARHDLKLQLALRETFIPKPRMGKGAPREQRSEQKLHDGAGSGVVELLRQQAVLQQKLREVRQGLVNEVAVAKQAGVLVAQRIALAEAELAQFDRQVSEASGAPAVT